MRLLSGAIFASAVITIGWPQLSVGPVRAAYLFTPLTTILTLALAVTGPGSVGQRGRYWWGLVAGLAWSLAGDVLLMLPRDRFLAGLGCFLVAQVCYLVAFTSDTPFAARRLPFLGWGLVGVAALTAIWPNLPAALRIPVVLYAGLLLTMAAQAASRAAYLRTPAALGAALGATFFVASDTLLGLNRFGFAVPHSRLLVLGTYFTAQWLIARSNQRQTDPWNSRTPAARAQE
jgi:uncharacterized membrane protein YhhN